MCLFRKGNKTYHFFKIPLLYVLPLETSAIRNELVSIREVIDAIFIHLAS